MRIHFERTGGFAAPAMKRTCTVDTESLPPAEAQELRALIDAADIASLAARPAVAASTPRRDAFSYRLVVDDGREHHAVEVSEDMPDSLRPLIRWLMKRASAGSGSPG